MSWLQKNKLKLVLACLMGLAGLGQVGKAEDLVGPALEELPSGGRKSLEHDLNRTLADWPSLQLDDAKARANLQYCEMTAQEVQCQAASASSNANLLDRERQAIQSRAKHQLHASSLAEMQQTILLYKALEARNQSAGGALEVFYHLAEADANWELHQLSLAHVEEAMERTKELLPKGARVPADYELLRRQELDLQADGVNIHLATKQLDGSLRRLLGYAPCQEYLQIWPVLCLQAPASSEEMHEALAVGMAHRPELIMLRKLAPNLRGKTLPAARQLLGSANPLLGSSDQRPMRSITGLLLPGLLITPSDRAELQNRQGQVRSYQSDREQTVAYEICQAFHAVVAQKQLVGLAKEKADSWLGRVKDLEEKEPKGIGVFEETTRAKLEWLKARGEVVKQVVAWQIAVVKLKQAQGLLAEECGYGGPEGGSCCSRCRCGCQASGKPMTECSKLMSQN